MGLLEAPKLRGLSNDIKYQFNLDCKMLTASRNRVYAGKLLATISRNTIKDTFDLDRIKKPFLYLLLNANGNKSLYMVSPLLTEPF